MKAIEMRVVGFYKKEVVYYVSESNQRKRNHHMYVLQIACPQDFPSS